MGSDKKGYCCIRAGYGYYTFEVDSYVEFIHKIAPKFVGVRLSNGSPSDLEPQEFIWRGMRDPSWTLQSSLSRFVSDKIRVTGLDWQREVSEMTTQHVIAGINQMRGLGLLTRQHDDLYQELLRHLGKRYISFVSVLDSLTPSQVFLTLELFSMGQHYGMLTPFLDWTSIPLIALYFAFEQMDERRDGEGYRVVFALNQTALRKFCPPNEAIGPDSILCLGSMAHDNPRIIAQSGVFTFVPAHLPVDQWVVSRWKDTPLPGNVPILFRFLIRNGGRPRCLQELAAANIHARTVFPDRFGAALHSNFLLESAGSHASAYGRGAR